MFDPVRICEILNEEHVRYVVLGGVAAVMHGSSLPTRDLDLVPDQRRDNLVNLSRALRRLGARVRAGDESFDARLDPEFLERISLALNLSTEYGDLDLTFVPDGPLSSFDDWSSNSSTMEMSEGLVVLVAALDDLIESKRAANRPKDIAALPYLESLRDQSGS